jgi:segregation and condensation protein A
MGTETGIPEEVIEGVERDAAREEDILAGLRPPAYQVRLASFEGPLDLLLHLIKRDEIDIFDIPIARLTEEYLAEIRIMELLDLEVAGEFLVMAATLLRIKARMLLPRTEDEEAVEEDDPREELVQRLLEYREFKRGAEDLGQREEWRRALFGRALPPGDKVVEEELVRNATLYDLVRTYREVLERTPRLDSFEVILDEITLEDKMAEITERLSETERIDFRDLLESQARRIQIIITFIALLELTRLGKISLIQSALFEPIWIERR